MRAGWEYICFFPAPPPQGLSPLCVLKLKQGIFYFLQLLLDTT